MPLPALRYLDVAPLEHNGETVICLRDPEGYVPEPLVLSPAAFFVASCLDGENEVTDIQYAFCNQTNGRVLSERDIAQVVEILDGHGFLLTQKFLDIRNQAQEVFRGAPTRPATLAGKSYPADPLELRKYIDGLFLRPGGPGEPAGPAAADGAPLSALIVPHIDFDRGGHSYAHGYLKMARAGRPDTAFVFGVAHAGPFAPFVMTRKHFETPLGLLDNDTGLVDRIAGACDWDPFEFEIVHRTEHSIEFQAVMLAYLYGSAVKIVPILCGPFEVNGTAGDASSRVEAFLAACRDAIRASGKRVTVIAGADLAHVGRRFGDAFDMSAPIIERVEARDREDLAHALALDPGAWYQSVLRDDNERRVCGLNCIYSTLRSVEGRAQPGQLVQYGYAPDPAGGIVSFANLVFA
jgi:hypothetical protein